MKTDALHRSATRRFDFPDPSRYHPARQPRVHVLRACHRSRDPRPAADGDEDLLRLQHALRRAARTRTSVRCASACPARCRCSTSAPSSSATRAALALGCTVQPDVDLRAQELLLSGPAEGLSDLAVRAAARDGRARRLRERRRGANASASRASTWKRTPASRCTKGFADSDRTTYLDFNRSGVPLIEIVTEPDLRSAADAERVLQPAARDPRRHRRQRRQHGRGQPALRRERVGAAGRAATTLGTKAEVKNLNSFRFLQKALEYEIERQIDARSSDGGRVVQETRLWDTAAGRTVSMRSKEEAHDYRYFPEPDLPPLVLDPALDRRRSAATLPELPDARRRRFVAQYALPGVRRRRADAVGGARRLLRGDGGGGGQRQGGEQLGHGRADAQAERATASASTQLPMTPDGARRPDRARRRRARSAVRWPRRCSRRCRDRAAPPTRSSPPRGWRRSTTTRRSRRRCGRCIDANADAVAQYRAGKQQTFGFLVGQVMKATEGKAEPGARQRA